MLVLKLIQVRYVELDCGGERGGGEWGGCSRVKGEGEAGNVVGWSEGMGMKG